MEKGEIHMEKLRNEAKALKDTKKYSEAIVLYAKLYDSSSNNWLSWEYAYCLKQNKEIDQAIIICKNSYAKDKTFKYNNDLLAWLLYEKYFKPSQNEYSKKELENLYTIAKFIPNLVDQNSNSPYEKIMLSSVKKIDRHSNILNSEILELLSLITPNLLSNQPGKFKKDDKESEYQSNKEYYYSIKAKILYSEQLYNDCIACCDEAMETIELFHHNNDMWIKYRKALCWEKIGKTEEAVLELKELIAKKKHWVVCHSIAKIYDKSNDQMQALLYFSIASLDSVADNMKVTLFQDFAFFLNKINKVNFAYNHAMYAKKLRETESWSIPKELNHLIDVILKKLSEESGEISKKQLKVYWLDNVRAVSGLEYGKVTSIHKNKKFGFISSGTKSYYFQMKSVIDKKHFKPNDIVEFTIVDSFDTSKKKATKEAAYICLSTSLLSE